MRLVIIAFFVLGAFLAGLMTGGTGDVTADTRSEKNQWQHQCFKASGVEKVNELANKMGREGWELVTGAGPGPVWCFKRPLWKR